MTQKKPTQKRPTQKRPTQKKPTQKRPTPKKGAGSKASQNKTQLTDVDPLDFIASLENPTRQSDALVLLEMLGRVSGCEPQMWGPTIIGFGRYHYKYDSGREGDHLVTGFSPRKANLVLYIMPGYDDHSEWLAKLGKHKVGKSCLYINKLADVDLPVLEQIVSTGVASVRRNYETWEK